jgi:hypothetical protein
MRPGVLRNPASTGNRGRPAVALPEGVLLAETDVRLGSAGALERLRDAGAEVIVIDGGDGTVREAVTRLPSVFGAFVPPIGILARGNTNLIARRLGAVRGTDGLARLLAMTPAETVRHSRTAPVLTVAFADGRPPERGFIAGWGAYATGTRIGAEEISARHGSQVLRAVLATLARSLWGRDAAALRRGVPCTVEVDGCALPEAPRFLGMVTTLPGPLIGPLRPFWGSGRCALRWLDVVAPPRLLGLAAPVAALGWPAERMSGWLARQGYRSGRCAAMTLDLGGPVVVDGETFGGPGPQRLTLRAESSVAVVSV